MGLRTPRAPMLRHASAPRTESALTFKPLVGICALSLWLAGLLRLALGLWFPASAAFALLVAFGTHAFITGWIGNNPSLRHPRGAAATRVALAAFVVIPFLGALEALTVRPVLELGKGVERLDMAEGFVPMVGFFCLPPIAGLLAALVARQVEKLSPKRMRWVLTLAALVSLIALGTLTTLGILRTPGRYQPDTYAQSLPVGGVLKPNAEVRLQGLDLSATCDGDGWCTPRARQPDQKWFTFPPVALPGDTIEYRDDARAGVILLTSKKGQAWAIATGSFENATLSLGVTDVAKSLATPMPWLVLAVLGILVVLVSLAMSLLAPRTPDALLEATSDAEGRVRFADGNEVTLPKGHTAPPSSVLTLTLAENTAGSTYRTGQVLHATSAWLGTPADVVAWHQYLPSARTAWAIAVCVLCAGPLLTAASFGLIWP